MSPYRSCILWSTMYHNTHYFVVKIHGYTPISLPTLNIQDLDIQTVVLVWYRSLQKSYHHRLGVFFNNNVKMIIPSSITSS